jgi:O-methyltransferase
MYGRPQRFQGYPIISEQISREGLAVIWRELEYILQQNIPGHIVEFGCYLGTTSLFLRRLLDKYAQSEGRELHVYDSFEGLPAKTAEDTSAAGTDFAQGKIAASKKQLLQEFRRANLKPPIIHKNWFNQLTQNDIPTPIAFAFLDGDFYESILDSLNLIWPNLSKHACIVVDDYRRPELPGTDKALAKFFQNNSHRIRSDHQKAVINL